MKKWILPAAVMILLIPLCVRSAYADLISIPLADQFYESHAEDCVYEDRYYTVVAEDGAIGAESPENLREVMRIQPGTEIYISYVYETKKGLRYGLYEELFDESGEYLPESEQKSGWFLMDTLFESYGGERFAEEYGSEIREEFWALSQEQMENLKGKSVWYYAYPGGDGIREAKFQEKTFTGREHSGLYTDPYQNTWAFMGTMRVRAGKKEAVWILLDDPAKTPEELYQKNRFQPDTRTWPKGIQNPVIPSAVSEWKIAALCVGIPLAVSVVGMGLFFLYVSRKNRKKKSSRK
ncbi:MAG: hypothetical protein IKS18_05820 [Lachnospiraceae bacterium]|nr:hypothetical protein [Lachnospiraceae bacterium]